MKPGCAYKSPKTILNKGTGFLSGYSYSLNPYTGCAFGCSYCYVRRMPVSIYREEEWGSWIDVKQNAAELFRKEYRRAKEKGPVTIFMSSSTDPYQPIEHKERITRSLLEIMAECPPDFLLVQTRSPLVHRDIDLLVRLGDAVRVSMTVETDLEEIRKHFSPKLPHSGTAQDARAAGGSRGAGPGHDRAGAAEQRSVRGRAAPAREPGMHRRLFYGRRERRQENPPIEHASVVPEAGIGGMVSSLRLPHRLRSAAAAFLRGGAVHQPGGIRALTLCASAHAPKI